MATQERSYPGYGIIYPQNSTQGLRVVRIATEGAKKIRHADGSFDFSTPHPTILELVGGGFSYASGQAVNKKEDLEWLPSAMRDKALKWFDNQRVIPKEAIVDTPEPTSRQEPDAQWILSSDRPDLLDLDEKPKPVVMQPENIDKSQSAVMSALDAIMNKLGGMEERLSAVEKGTPKVSDKAHFARKAHSEHMKEVWAKKRAAKATAEATQGQSGDVTDGG